MFSWCILNILWTKLRVLNYPLVNQCFAQVKNFVKIGRPGYKVTKQKDPNSDQHSLLFQVHGNIVPCATAFVTVSTTFSLYIAHYR